MSGVPFPELLIIGKLSPVTGLSLSSCERLLLIEDFLAATGEKSPCYDKAIGEIDYSNNKWNRKGNWNSKGDVEKRLDSIWIAMLWCFSDHTRSLNSSAKLVSAVD
jgi:hypothetical protein